MILFDLEGDESIWIKVLEYLGQQETGGAKLVAFGPHENMAVLERAKVLGLPIAIIPALRLQPGPNMSNPGLPPHRPTEGKAHGLG